MSLAQGTHTAREKEDLMAVGAGVWIGIKVGTHPTDDDHADTRTVSFSEESCLKKIHDVGRAHDLIPALRTLILKGRLCDR